VGEGLNELASGDWLNIGDFEELFWEQSQKIRSSDPKATKEGKFFVSQHPSRSTDGPGSKLVDEWLPLLILAKHEVGRKKNWDALFYLRVSNGEDAVTNDGRSYDAEYCFKDYNLGFGERAGYLEITRGISSQQSQDLKERDRALSQGILPALEVRDQDAGLTDMKEQILEAVARKKEMAQAGIYPAKTTLLIWLREELNLPLCRTTLQEEKFRQSAREVVENAFNGLVLVGVTCGVIWISGDGL
jgi:hypothetical protein